MEKRLSALLLAIFVALAESQVAKPLKTKSLGCKERNVFISEGKPFFNARSLLNWSELCKNGLPCDFTPIVQMCAQKSPENIFAVHYWGECWTNSNPSAYPKTASKDCYGPVGGSVGSSASAVYEIICDGGHSSGSYWYVPQTVDKCLSCKCQLGRTTCVTMRCDYPFPCEKYTPAQNGQCCRKCACSHKGVDKMNGEEWDDRRTPGVCRQCRCINGQASCTVQSCAVNCPSPEYIPGRCCPRCLPKAPTTRPWETIPSTRPPPTFPPWFPQRPSRFGRKRSLTSKKRFAWKLTRQ